MWWWDLEESSAYDSWHREKREDREIFPGSSLVLYVKVACAATSMEKYILYRRTTARRIWTATPVLDKEEDPQSDGSKRT